MWAKLFRDPPGGGNGLLGSAPPRGGRESRRGSRQNRPTRRKAHEEGGIWGRIHAAARPRTRQPSGPNTTDYTCYGECSLARRVNPTPYAETGPFWPAPQRSCGGREAGKPAYYAERRGGSQQGRASSCARAAQGADKPPKSKAGPTSTHDNGARRTKTTWGRVPIAPAGRSSALCTHTHTHMHIGTQR